MIYKININPRFLRWLVTVQKPAIMNRANEIVDKAMSNASNESRKFIDQAKEQAQSMIDSAQKEIIMEAEKIKQDLRNEVALMSVNLAGKVLKREINEDDHKELINKNLDAMGI